MRDFVNSTLADVRLAANLHRRERMSTSSFLEDLLAASSLRAKYQGLQFTATLAGADPIISVDPQLLGSAVTNLLNNAFKYSRKDGSVALTWKRDGDKVVIAVRDECGGIPASVGDPFKPFGERRGKDRTGLGLGLSIARHAVRAHGGDIHVHNVPGEGCVFSIEVPLADAALDIVVV
jgi:signal transduction histidine kinase